jgi:hypothetical protein
MIKQNHSKIPMMAVYMTQIELTILLRNLSGQLATHSQPARQVQQ